MHIKELFDFIYDEFKNYENVEGIAINNMNSKLDYIVEHIMLSTHNVNYLIQADLYLMIMPKEAIQNFEVKHFDDIDMLRYELQGLLCQNNLN